MTVSIVEIATQNATSTGSPAATLSNTPAAGDILVALVETSSSRTVSSVSGAGATWSVDLTGGRAHIAVGTGANASGAVTATLSASVSCGMQVYLVRGLTSPTWDVDSTADSDMAWTGPTDTVAVDDVVLAALGTANVPTTVTWGGTGFTVDHTTQGTGIYRAASLIAGSAGTYGTTGTSTQNSANTIAQVALRGASGTYSGSGALYGTATTTATGVVSGPDPVGSASDEVVLEDSAYVTLTPAAGGELPAAVPVLRQSHQQPVLDADNPVHQEGVTYPVVVPEVVGYVHLWVNGQDVTYLRGKPVVVHRWESEAPFGDKTAMFSFPQRDPWDVDGEDDLAFLTKDAEVVIGIVDTEGNVRDLWSGFYTSRSKSLDESEDYVYEARGALWAAMFQYHDPVPYLEPTDIGTIVPRILNEVHNRRWAPMSEVVTGIPTRNRGRIDQYRYQYVQDLLSEAWTDDGRQWTIVEVTRDDFQLQLKKPMDEVDATVAYGTQGVGVDITIDEDTRVDVVFARGVAPGGGGWANVFYPGLELINPPPYPFNDAGTTMNIGTTDGDTDTGTGVSDWQRRVNELGSYGRLTVDGVYSQADYDACKRLQRALDITVDGSVGPQTWTRTFTVVDESIDLTPLRLPMAYKPEAWPWLHAANGKILGPNPAFDETIVPRHIALDLGSGVKKNPQGRQIAQTYLTVNGDAVATGSVVFNTDPNDVDRTTLTHGDNLEVRGFEGRDLVVQSASKSIEMDAGNKQYVASFRVDERARDALTVEQLLQRNRDARPDPARRPGNPNRSTRNVRDEGFTWDDDSPCGILTRTAVNGDVGLWTKRVIPFAEIGQLAGIKLRCTVPFYMGLFASLRITENIMRDTVGDPSASADPWRPHIDLLENTYGFLGGWGEQGNACGYYPGTQRDGYDFSGIFREANTLEYVTETVPYVAVMLFADASGFVSGDRDGEGFLPARQT